MRVGAEPLQLSSDKPRRLMGILASKLPWDRCQDDGAIAAVPCAVGVGVSLGVGPLPKHAPMKLSALPLVFGLWAWYGCAEAEFAAGVAEMEGFGAGAVVGHDAGDGVAEACNTL